MSRIHLKSHTVALWLLTAVAAAGAVAVGCSSSSDADDSAAAGTSSGQAGSSGKAGSGEGGGDTSSSGDAGAAGAGAQTSSGGAATVPSSDDAGAGGTGAGGDDSTAEAGAGGSQPVMADPTAAAVARAKKLIAGLEMPCTSCHQANYAGANYWPNLTPDEDTGIGTWSDDDIKKAITKGIGIDDHVFCGEMQRFQWTDSQLNDVVTFLHSLKPVSKKITKPCTTAN